MTANLLPPRKRRGSLLEPLEPPDGTVPPDDDEPTELNFEEEDLSDVEDSD